MPTTVPTGFAADASLRVWYVTSLANPAAPSVGTEINAGSTVDISCYLTNGFSPDAAVATITDDRLCLSVVLEGKGTTTWSLGDLEYIWDPQTPASTSNKAFAGMPEDGAGYIVARYGVNVDTAPAAGQKVFVFPVTMGPQIPLPLERNTRGRVKQKPFVSGVVQKNVSLAA